MIPSKMNPGFRMFLVSDNDNALYYAAALMRGCFVPFRSSLGCSRAAKKKFQGSSYFVVCPLEGA